MPNGVGAMSVRPPVSARKQRTALRTIRHSSAHGINLQIARRRSANLLHRCARQARQSLARLASGRVSRAGLPPPLMEQIGVYIMPARNCRNARRRRQAFLDNLPLLSR
jgi:hypothetical protein